MLGSIAAQRAALDASYGSGLVANWALALFDGDPTLDEDPGVEATSVTCPGYVRKSFADSAWAAADAYGVKQTTTVKTFANATAEWTITLTHWGLYDVATGVLWNVEALSTPLDVTAAGTGPALLPKIFYENALEG